MSELFAFADTLFQAEIFDPNRYNNYLILGYFAMWLIVMVYIFTLANRQKNAREEIQLMKQLLEEDEEPTNR
jgi:CcmD family protein